MTTFNIYNHSSINISSSSSSRSISDSVSQKKKRREGSYRWAQTHLVMPVCPFPSDHTQMLIPRWCYSCDPTHVPRWCPPSRGSSPQVLRNRSRSRQEAHLRTGPDPLLPRGVQQQAGLQLLGRVWDDVSVSALPSCVCGRRVCLGTRSGQYSRWK